jgi:hypothetical protein
MPKLPSKDKVTFRWLIDRIPITWWVAMVSVLLGIFSAGVEAGRWSFQGLDGDIASKIAVRDQLQSDIQQLSSRKDQLHDKLVSLEVEIETKKMTPEQVREELKAWTRD